MGTVTNAHAHLMTQTLSFQLTSSLPLIFEKQTNKQKKQQQKPSRWKDETTINQSNSGKLL